MKGTILVILLVCLFAFPTAALAEPDASLENVLGLEGESATVEDVREYVDGKSSSIIDLLKYAAEPILIIAFILFALISVLGVFGNGSLIGKGIVGMAMSGLGYTLVVYSAEILRFISNFFSP